MAAQSSADMMRSLALAICAGAVGSFGSSTIVKAHEVTTADLASFLDVRGWSTRVTLPPGTYTLDICPIEDGKVGEGLFANQIDWSKDPTGNFIIMAGPEGENYKISVSSQTGGFMSISTSGRRFKATFNPPLPETVSEGVYPLIVDLDGRKPDGAEYDPATYKRGFVLKVSKKG